jgi:exopolysaccharide biosynthesis polyprenyl glycosylphosphotransferase
MGTAEQAPQRQGDGSARRAGRLAPAIDDVTVDLASQAIEADDMATATAAAEADRAARSFDELMQRSAVPASRKDSMRRRLLAAADAVAIALAYVAALATTHQRSGTLIALAATLPLWVLLNKLSGLYDRDANVVHASTLNELPKLAQAMTFGVAILYIFGPPLVGARVGRANAVELWAAGICLMAALRSLVRHEVRRRFRAERAVIVGSGAVAQLVARKINSHPEFGVEVVGFVDIPPDARDRHDGDLLGDIARFEQLCREFEAERIIIGFSSASTHEHLLDAIRVSRLLNLKITVVPRLFEVIGGSVEIDEIEGMTMLGLRGLGRTRSSLLLKRLLDVAVAVAVLVLIAPLLALIAIAIKLDSRGRVLFVQRRIGKDAKPFPMFKFRTMVSGADALKEQLAHLNEAHYPMFKIPDDPRVTRVGGLLRRTSLDELPQLINVLRGQMSLVGPRPLVPQEHDHVIGWHRARLDLTPGLTGPWQVMGRTRIPFDEMVKLDYLYVNEWSLWNDLKLLLRTAKVVAARSGH